MRTPSPTGPFPSAPAPVTRLNGRYAVCTLGAFVLTAFDWEMEIMTEFVDGTGFGDIFDVPVPLKYSWTARVRGYFDTVTHTSYMRTGYNAQLTGSPPPDITAVVFTAYRDDAPTNAVFTGSGFLVRARWSAPHAMAEQELEIRGTGIPTAIGA